MDYVPYTQLPNDLLQLRLQLKKKLKLAQHQRSFRHNIDTSTTPNRSPIRLPNRQLTPRRQKRPSSASSARRSTKLSPNKFRRNQSDTNAAKRRPQTARVRSKPIRNKPDIYYPPTEPTHVDKIFNKSKQGDVRLQNELSIIASMLSSNRKIRTGLLSKRTHEKLNKTIILNSENRIDSIKPKTEYLMKQYLHNRDNIIYNNNKRSETNDLLFDSKFSIQWIIEQTGLSPHEVDKLIEDEVESSVIMSNMKSKITSKIACCLCLNGLVKIGNDLPQYSKFLQTARRVLFSSIFEDNNENRNDSEQHFRDKNHYDKDSKIKDKFMYKSANNMLRDENDELRARIRQLESESIMNPQTLILEKVEQITEDQRKTLFSKFANVYSEEYAASLSSQTNQNALKQFHYASWYRLNRVSKQEILLRTLTNDNDIIQSVLFTQPTFLHKALLIKNGELLHSFLWEHMDSVTNMVRTSQELFDLFCSKKGKILCAMILKLFSSETKIFWEGHWPVISKFASKILLTDPYVAVDAFRADAGLFADIYLENNALFIDLIGTHPVLLQSLFNDGIDVVSDCLYKFPEILDVVLNCNNFAGAIAKRNDTAFMKLVLEILSGKVLQYYQENPENFAELIFKRPKLLIDAEKGGQNGSLICHVAQFEPTLFTKNVPFLKLLNLTVLNTRKTIATQTNIQQYNQFASTIVYGRPSKPLTVFHWLSDNNNKSKSKQKETRRSSIGGKSNYKWWPDSQLNSTILDIYIAKIRANRIDRNLGHPFDNMADFILDYFTMHGKSNRIGMKQVQELLVSVQRFNVNNMPRRIFWFGIVAGCFETSDFKFHEASCDTLLNVLELIFPNENDIISKMSDNQIMCVVRYDKAIEIAKHFFTPNRFKVEDLEAVTKNINKIAKTAQALPSTARIDAIDRGNEVERFVDVDDIIHNIMSIWFEVENREHETILSLFHCADANKNGLLDIKEFEVIVNKIIVPNLDRRTMLKLFRQGGFEDINGEIELTPDDFITILRDFMRKNQVTMSHV